MNKIININLAGRMIAIDESAYEPLRQYINWLRLYFGKEPDGLEIVQDMESRIAEIFENKLRKGSPCIINEDVQHMISIMGSPEQLQSENPNEESSIPFSNNNNHQEYKKRLYRNENRKVLGGVCAGIADHFNIDPIIIRIAFIFFTITWGIGLIIYIIMWMILPSAQPSITAVTKRLYRNTDKKVIAGVCSGLAAYFKTDVVIVRLLFVAPLLLLIFFKIIDAFWGVERFLEGGMPSMFLLYIVLWISIPSAKTLPEKLEMSGAKVDVQNLSQAMRNEPTAAVPKSSSNIIATLIKVFVFIILVMILMVICSIIIAILGLVIGYGFSPLKNEFPFYNLIISDADTELILWTSIILLLVAPLILIVMLMKRVLSGRKNNQSNFWYKILPIFFILGIVGVVFSAKDILSNFFVKTTINDTVLSQIPTADTLYFESKNLNFSQSKSQSKYSWSGNKFLVPIDGQSFAFRNVAFDFKQSDNDSMYINVSKSAYGKNANAATENIDNIDYKVTQQGNRLELESYTTLAKDNPFYFQGVDVTIYIPEGTIFKVNESMIQSNKNMYTIFTTRFVVENGLKGRWSQDKYYKFQKGTVVPA